MARAHQRQHAQQHRDREPARAEPPPCLGEHRLHLRHVVQRLGHDQVGSGGELPLQAVPLGRGVVGGGVEGARDGERGPVADGRARLVLSAVEPREDLDQADGVHVPDARAGGVVADARRVPGERQDVADAQGVGAQELGFEGHQVAIAGRGVDDALDGDVVLDAEGDGHGAHADPGHRRVADVHHVRAGVAEQSRRLERAIDADAARRVDLDGDHEASLGEGACEAGLQGAILCIGALGVCLREGRAGARTGDRAGAVEGVRASLRTAPVRGGDGPESVRHGCDVGGRRPATAADHRRPRVEQLPDDGPEVGGLRRVDEAALQALRQAGVGHHGPGRLALAGGARAGRGRPGRRGGQRRS